MTDKPATLRCAKCLTPAASGAVCDKCDGRLVKVCGNCDGHNSPVKNFCDHCGLPLRLYPNAAKKASIPSVPPSPELLMSKTEGAPPALVDPDKELPQTNVIRLDRDAAEASAEPGGVVSHSDRFRNQNTSSMRRANPPSAEIEPKTAGKTPGATTLLWDRRTALFSTWLALALFAFGLFLLFLRWKSSRRPEAAILAASDRYLNALHQGRIDAAYRMLTDAAREHCPVEEFKLIRDNTPWTYSDVKLLFHEGSSALVSYALAEQGRPIETDYLIFSKENGRWARPFTWNLFNRVEDAFDRDNTDLAYLDAKAAVAVSPIDPMAQSYLCEAAYYKNQPEEALKECRAAVALARRYPSRLTPQSLYHLHAILGDTLKNALHRYPEAVEEYSALLAFPMISRPDQCDARLARADARVALEAYADAVKDFQASGSVCAKIDDLAYLQRAVRVLSGNARDEAVAVLQNFRHIEGGPTMLEWRDQARAEFMRGQRRGKRQPRPPAERWSAEFIGGTRYRVRIAAGNTPLLSADVDLWTDSVDNIQAHGI